MKGKTVKLFLVDTVSSFRNSYVVRCENEEHAKDTVATEVATEFSQEWLGEQIARVREITEDDYLVLFDKENDYLKNWDIEKKKSLITQVNYVVTTDEEKPGIDMLVKPGNL
jgi:hypothetical protein